MSINREQRRVGDPEGLSILEEVATLGDRIKTIEKKNELVSSFVDDLVLIRAGCLDDWSKQKQEQEETRILRNDLAHRGNIV